MSNWYRPTTGIDKLFEGGLIIKGFTGLLEFSAGLALVFVRPDTISRFVATLTQPELAEDPRDRLVHYLMQSVRELGGTSRAFLIAYLWVHAAVKLIAVIGLLRNHLWAYPFSLITLGLLMLYQVYSIIFVSPSLLMIGLTLFDVVVLWLIWHEYGIMRLRLKP